MNEQVQLILSMSIILPFIVGIVRLKTMDPSYYPFIWFLGVGVVMEFLPFYLYQSFGRTSTVVLVNVYALWEILVITWLFYSWSLFRRNKKLFWFIMSLFMTTWLVLTCIIQKPTGSNFSFRVLFAVAVIILSVTMINKLVATERGNLLKSAKFLICIGMIVFYTFFALANATELSFFSEKASSFFRQYLQYIPAWSNFITNLVYTLAIIWIPRKKSFINPF